MHTSNHQQPTKKQQEILYLLYRFRFLSTRHIQFHLKHKDPRRIQKWLKQLTTQKFIHCIYDPKTLEGKKSPAVYCLNTKARQILKNNEDCDKLLLSYLYKEKKRSVRFKNHNLLLADIYFLLLTQSKTNNENLHFSTKSDLLFYKHFPHPLPDAYIAIKNKERNDNDFFLILLIRQLLGLLLMPEFKCILPI